MDPAELARLNTLYSHMNGSELRLALRFGPDGYRPEVWKVIAEEASRRGLPVPTMDELLSSP